jgi:predicted nuclease of predicted toxin-antitoxin system
MVEPVALLLVGRGHVVIRARDAGLADAADNVLVEYALIENLVVVTFDPDIRRAIRRCGARCLHIHPPELTARARLAGHYREVIQHFAERGHLVTLPRKGPPRRDDPQRLR